MKGHDAIRRVRHHPTHLDECLRLPSWITSKKRSRSVVGSVSDKFSGGPLRPWAVSLKVRVPSWIWTSDFGVKCIHVKMQAHQLLCQSKFKHAIYVGEWLLPNSTCKGAICDFADNLLQGRHWHSTTPRPWYDARSKWATPMTYECVMVWVSVSDNFFRGGVTQGQCPVAQVCQHYYVEQREILRLRLLKRVKGCGTGPSSNMVSLSDTVWSEVSSCLWMDVLKAPKSTNGSSPGSQ